MYTIYCATFPNGKKYIGKTGNFKKRVSLHRHYAFVKLHKNKFYYAMRKHGWPEWSIIGEFADESLAFDIEIATIRDLDTQAHGYNTASGGQGPSGVLKSPELCAAHSRRLKARYAKYGHTSTGTKRTPEQRALMSKKQLEAHTKRTPPVKVTHLASGEVTYFTGPCAAGRAYGLDFSRIYKVISGKSKHTHGYYLEYVM